MCPCSVGNLPAGGCPRSENESGEWRGCDAAKSLPVWPARLRRPTRPTRADPRPSPRLSAKRNTPDRIMSRRKQCAFNCAVLIFADEATNALRHDRDHRVRLIGRSAAQHHRGLTHFIRYDNCDCDFRKGQGKRVSVELSGAGRAGSAPDDMRRYTWPASPGRRRPKMTVPAASSPRDFSRCPPPPPPFSTHLLLPA